MPTQIPKLLLLCLMASFLFACTPISPNFAQRKAQPKVPPARNFTSFSASLRCMDVLLAANKRNRTLISSTGIPDQTKRISVGGDEMLINAINQMNRQSGSYLFVDQSLERDPGQISIYTPQKGSVTPTLYVRGAISQVDGNVSATSGDITATDQTGARDISSTKPSIRRDLSLVTVDMHLVSFPDRTVIPGSSVANSMVVSSRSFGIGATGVIDMTGLNASIQISRIESMGQAVRNLVELGTIELIGKHANVPYWECLNIPSVKQRQTNRKEIAFSSADRLARIPEVQRMLSQLGYYSGSVTGVMDQRSRDALSHFQASSGLIATGDLNYDSYQHLQEKTRGFAPKRRVEIIKDVDALSEPTPKAPTKPQNPFRQVARAGKGGLAISFTQRSHSIGDILRVQLVAPSAGFLSCFHQSSSGPVVQVFPAQPNVAFAVSKGQNILIPDSNAGFDIKLENSKTSENIMCVLERDVVPADISRISGQSTLAPLKVGSFGQVVSEIKSKSRRVYWGSVSAKAR